MTMIYPNATPTPPDGNQYGFLQSLSYDFDSFVSRSGVLGGGPPEYSELNLDGLGLDGATRMDYTMPELFGAPQPDFVAVVDQDTGFSAPSQQNGNAASYFPSLTSDDFGNPNRWY